MTIPTQIIKRLTRAAQERDGHQTLTVREIAEALEYDHKAVRRRLVGVEPLDETVPPTGPTGTGRPQQTYDLADVIGALVRWAQAHRHLAY